MDFKVLKINLQTKNIVISHKALIEKENDIQKDKFIAELEIGQVVEGVIKNITSYGAFVDLGFVDGLIHITDLTWSRINHPDDVVQLDQKLKVVVLDFDNDKLKIQLGLKQLDTNILKAFNELKVGDKVNCEIALITDYGVFVKINAGNEALIHISELSWLKVPMRYSDRKNFIQKLYSIGDKIDAIILKIDTEEHKISMSFKKLQVNPWAILNVGDMAKGKVVNINNLGVSVELSKGVYGFIDIAELSYFKVPYSNFDRIKYIRKILFVGDEIESLILSIDKVNQKVFLSLKKSQENPWLNLVKNITRKDIVKGKVFKIVEFGAFIKLANGLVGVLFISDMCHSKIPYNNDDRFVFIRNIMAIGDVIDVVVLKIDINKCQISFGLKQLQRH